MTLLGGKKEGWGRVCQLFEYTCEYDGIDDSTGRQKGKRMEWGLSGVLLYRSVSMMALTTLLGGKWEEGWGGVCQVFEYTREYDCIDDSTGRQKGRASVGQGGQMPP